MEKNSLDNINCLCIVGDDVGDWIGVDCVDVITMSEERKIKLV